MEKTLCDRCGKEKKDKDEFYRFIMSEYGGIMKRDKRNRNLGACSDKTLGCPSNCTEANVFRCPPELIGG